jgi:hypothetical protein
VFATQLYGTHICALIAKIQEIPTNALYYTIQFSELIVKTLYYNTIHLSVFSGMSVTCFNYGINSRNGLFLLVQDFGVLMAVLLMIQVFWDAVLCHRVSGPRYLKGSRTVQLPG